MIKSSARYYYSFFFPFYVKASMSTAAYSGPQKGLLDQRAIKNKKNDQYYKQRAPGLVTTDVSTQSLSRCPQSREILGATKIETCHSHVLDRANLALQDNLQYIHDIPLTVNKGYKDSCKFIETLPFLQALTLGI